jgi:roadblock/LC7 domain-containing protein
MLDVSLFVVVGLLSFLIAVGAFQMCLMGNESVTSKISKRPIDETLK